MRWIPADKTLMGRARATPRFVAAGELGSGVWFNPVVPEKAAAQLREVVSR